MDLEWDTYRDSTRKWQPRERGDYWSNLEPDEILARALKWLTIVEKETGRVPIVYTSRTWWMERIKDERKLERLETLSDMALGHGRRRLASGKAGRQGPMGGQMELDALAVHEQRRPDQRRNKKSAGPKGGTV